MENKTFVINSMIAGAFAGLTVDLTLFPLDTIKTRLQSKENFKAVGGFKNIYRGLSCIAFGSAPGSALFFVTYNASNVWFSGKTPINDAIKASISEISACLIRVPTELVKQRAQVTNFISPVEIIKEIYKEKGFYGFYKGFNSTIFREIPFSFIQFPLWEFLKRNFAKANNKTVCTPAESAIFGSVAGFFAAGLTTPLDIIKTRIMLDKSNENELILKNAIKIIKNEGVKKLYAGILPRSLWMSIGGFIYFFTYEFVLKILYAVRV